MNHHPLCSFEILASTYGPCSKYAPGAVCIQIMYPEHIWLKIFFRLFMVQDHMVQEQLVLDHKSWPKSQKSLPLLTPSPFAKILLCYWSRSRREETQFSSLEKVYTGTHVPGGTQLWVGYGCAALSFDHHPVTKPEKTQICNLCLNHLFLEGPFFKPISTFYHVNVNA